MDGIQWSGLDTWIALTAAVVAMSCAVPGTFLVLRRQSMLGDALSHTVLPGIVVAFLIGPELLSEASRSSAATEFGRVLLLVGGAVAAGLLTALLTETVQRFGGVEGSAALGVIYTSLFALGLVLVQWFARSIHLDADCVLFGAVETVVFDTLPDSPVPRALAVNGLMLGINLLLVTVAFKELRLTTFDPGLATSLGFSAPLVHYLLMAVTAVTLVTAFRSVGSILVITVLVAPAATALLLTDRLWSTLIVAVGLAGLAGLTGHGAALLLPLLVLQPLGLTTVDDVSTSGMAAVVCGLEFGLALLFSPQKGLVSQTVRRSLLAFRISCEDLLGTLYRAEEAASVEAGPPDGGSSTVPGPAPSGSAALRPAASGPATIPVPPVRPAGPGLRRRGFDRLVRWRLSRLGLVTVGSPTQPCRLTVSGRRVAARVVRSHRLWESYLARHFPLPGDHLHAAAHQVEHFLDDHLLTELETELDRPGRDPHGRSIPPAESPSADRR